MMKDALVVEIRGCRNSREEDLHSIPCIFSFRCGGQSTLQSLVILHSSLNPLSLTTSTDTLGGEELSQVPMLRLTPSIGVRTFKLKRSLAQSEATFSWID
jgi:hypothetical protein